MAEYYEWHDKLFPNRGKKRNKQPKDGPIEYATKFGKFEFDNIYRKFEANENGVIL